MSFSYYVDPTAVVGEATSDSRQLYTGIGSEGDREAVVIGICEQGDIATIELARGELQEVIVDLVRLLAAMGDDA